ncbi:group I truncated hemoglobin [Thiomonas bhubaneswarensis]|uniref:Truncated hemoglobin YjbI n=1 Tax=Thiomonas bhubaneswarensis TaxID=339866 RepID=A0A0K6I8L9_9BURK|nr:group 1 truncated hemoglobin [Thiomonas bhubaneswarensis]CUA99479.1 Truncated hemoglobin YjbI [Thiomonas bhubaneswarensis]
METLYQRLNGKEGITRIVDDFVAAHLANPAIKARFENVKDIDHAKRMGVEFMCAGAGGPQAYTGKDMLEAHKGMNISEQEYLAVMDDIVAGMTHEGVDDATKGEVIAILYSLKGDIIRV